MTFWLDGHYHPAGKNRLDNTGNFEWGNSKEDDDWTPVFRELQAIAKHPVKNHNILIDDMREFVKPCYGNVSKKDLEAAILKINPNYKFKYYDGVVEEDVLAAYIEEEK